MTLSRHEKKLPLEVTPRAKVIREAIEHPYGKKTPVAAYIVSTWLDLNWDSMGLDGFNTVEEDVRIVLWNAFPGGGTAAIVAHRVVKAVLDMDASDTVE